MVTVHFGGYQPPRSVHSRALRDLQSIVARRSGGEVVVVLRENVVAQGRRAAELLTMVARGDLDGCYFASSYLAARVPALNVLDLPFQIGSRSAMFAALDGAAGEMLGARIADATAYRVLGFWDNGIRHISNGVLPIHAPRDCAGLRLRTLDNALHQAAFARLGFRPEVIDVADLADAVAQRRVDAQENPLTNLVNFGLHAHHRFVSLTGHLQGVALVLVNRAWFDGLPLEVRALLAEAMRECETMQRAAAEAEDAACLGLLADAGIVPIAAEAIDLPAFRGAMADVVAGATATLDPVLRRALLAH
jgi:TRAP-type C4-dicarboxylate transport system substrate-binding protein